MGELIKRITCKQCHNTYDYDLRKGYDNPMDDAIVVKCKHCGRLMRVHRPAEMDIGFIQEEE